MELLSAAGVSCDPKDRRAHLEDCTCALGVTEWEGGLMLCMEVRGADKERQGITAGFSMVTRGCH